MVSSQASQSQLQNKTRLTTAILPMRDLHVPKRIQWHQLKFNAYYIARCVYLLVSKASADYYYYRNRQRKRWVYETVQMWVSTKTVSRCCESAVFNQANNSKQCWRQSTQQPAQLSAKTTSLNVQNMKTGAVYRDWYIHCGRLSNP